MLTATLTATLLSACVTESITTSTTPRGGSTSTNRPAPSSGSSSSSSGANPFNLNLQPGARTVTIDVRAAISTLGAVPYDNFSLPVVSPDGQFLATETGIAPTWAMMLGEDDASVPEATRIEVYHLDLRIDMPEAERRRIRLGVVLDEPVVLGRGSNNQGFLVEAPRANGSRWIGLASWHTGDIEWLVQDTHVNAFATLGPDGRLAWCRRRIGDAYFELVIRRNDQEWVFFTPGQDWLMPHWSGRDDGLFAFALREQRLDLAHLIASSESAMRQSLRLTPIASGANVFIAYQAAAATVSTVGLPRPRLEQMTFVHPAETRAAIWRPMSATGVAPILLEPDSLAVVADDTDVAFVTTARDLLRQSLADPRIKAKMLAGTLIPRLINHPDWHSILLSPQDGMIGVTVTRLLPPEQE